jgi:hypothetical protein
VPLSPLTQRQSSAPTLVPHFAAERPMVRKRASPGPPSRNFPALAPALTLTLSLTTPCILLALLYAMFSAVTSIEVGGSFSPSTPQA